MEKLLDHKILEELIAFEDETNVTCMMHPSESVTHWCNNCLEYICDVCIKVSLFYFLSCLPEYFLEVDVLGFDRKYEESLCLSWKKEFYCVDHL